VICIASCAIGFPQVFWAVDREPGFRNATTIKCLVYPPFYDTREDTGSCILRSGSNYPTHYCLKRRTSSDLLLKPLTRMKLVSLLTLANAATVVNAAYPGDIVYYW
jgi:hypothetical protein